MEEKAEIGYCDFTGQQIEDELIIRQEHAKKRRRDPSEPAREPAPPRKHKTYRESPLKDKIATNVAVRKRKKAVAAVWLYMLGCPTDQIAQDLHCSQDTVRAFLHAAGWKKGLPAPRRNEVVKEMIAFLAYSVTDRHPAVTEELNLMFPE